MADGNLSDEQDLPAGDFSVWMTEIQGALRGERGSDVPCGSCTACCTSSQFIHIGPDEIDTLAHVPSALLFPAPRLPRGHVLLGYDERGHCPMLVDGACSIYDHRPRTCRTYDCRVFAAAAVDAEADDKALIARQARRWRFAHPTDADRRQHDAVRTAAAFFREHSDAVPDAMVPANATQLAVLAVEHHDIFRPGEDRSGGVADPDPDAVRVELRRRAGAGARP